MAPSWRARPRTATAGIPAGPRRDPANPGAPAGRRPDGVPQDRRVPRPRPQLGSLTWLPAADRPDLLGAPVAAALSAARRPRLGGRDRRRAGRHRGVHRGLRGAAGGLGQLRRRRRPPGRADHAWPPASCWPPPAPTSTAWSAGTSAPARPRSRRRTSRSPRRGMAYGGITPVGLPDGWPVLVDAGGRGGGPRRHRLGHPRQQAGRARCGAGRAAGRRGARGARAAAGADAAPSPAPARPRRAPDDSDVGWGERPADPSDDDRRYLEDRPPHWGSD